MCVEPDEVIASVTFASVPVAKVCVEVERPFNEVTPPEVTLILVVLVTPFTVEVRIFVEVAKLILLVVDEATIPASDVVEVTPFTSDTKFVPEVERVLLPITEEVATTPLMVVVSTLPVNDCENELMMLAAADAIPFTVEVMVFTKEVSTFEVTAVVVAATPFTVEVIVLPEVVAVLVVGATRDDVAVQTGTPPTIESTVPFAPGAVGAATFDALPTKILPSASGILGSTEKVVVPSVVVPFTVRLLFKKRFVPVALPKRRLVKFASVEKRLVVVALTKEIFVPLAVLKLKFVV